jgi:hypothetical protein
MARVRGEIDTFTIPEGRRRRVYRPWCKLGARLSLVSTATLAERATGPDSQRIARLRDHMISIVKAQGRTGEASALKERAEQIIAKSRK